MKHIIIVIIVGMSMTVAAVAQDIPALLESLKKEKAPEKLADIHNLLAQAYLSKDGEKTITHAEESVKLARQVGNKVVEAEALSFQAKATAGFYLPDNSVPNRRNVSARAYYDAQNLYEKSIGLAKSTGYTQLELDILENLAYLNTKRIGRHDPDPREERKYFRQYITRIKEIKNITKPTASYTTPPSSNPIANTPPANNPPPPPTNNDPPQNAGSDKFVKELVKEKKDLQDKVDDLQTELNGKDAEVSQLKGELATANEDLRLALDDSTSEEELTLLKKKQKDVERALNKKEKEKKELEQQLTVQQQLEQERAEKLRQRLILGGTIVALIFASLFLGYRTQSRARKKLAEKNNEIAKEKERSDELLLNILPQNIAQELKTNGAAKARRHDGVTVLFSDFKNFTKVSETLSPEQLVKELDYCFKGFDYIISQYPSIEKIKTIGDAYMCCSGLNPEHVSTASADMVRAAMDMQEFLYDYKADRQNNSLPFFEARIGIHSGPVVAGVVGNKKFAYDIWGDTVNVASRMESNGSVGRVNISADTYSEVRYQFSCHPRGKIEVKNKGLVEMYFVDKVYG